MYEPVWEHRGVSLYTSPWVSGTRAELYHGPVLLDRIIKGNDADAMISLLDQLAEKVEALGGNALVNLSIAINPFFDSYPFVQQGMWHVEMSGTSAKLESLFG